MKITICNPGSNRQKVFEIDDYVILYLVICKQLLASSFTERDLVNASMGSCWDTNMQAMSSGLQAGTTTVGSVCGRAF